MSSLQERLSGSKVNASSDNFNQLLEALKGQMLTVINNQFAEIKKLIGVIGDENKESLKKLITITSSIDNNCNMFFRSKATDNKTVAQTTNQIASGQITTSTSKGNRQVEDNDSRNFYDYVIKEYPNINPDIEVYFEKALKEYDIKNFADLKLTLKELMSKDKTSKTLIPGIKSGEIWTALEKAFKAYSNVKPYPPAKPASVSDNTDIINLSNMLEIYDIDKKTISEIISKVKPILTKDDFTNDNKLQVSVFNDICSMLGIELKELGRIPTSKLYVLLNKVFKQ